MALLSSLLRWSFVSVVSFVATDRSSLVCECMGSVCAVGSVFSWVLVSEKRVVFRVRALTCCRRLCKCVTRRSNGLQRAFYLWSRGSTGGAFRQPA